MTARGLFWVCAHLCAVKVIILHWERRNPHRLNADPAASFEGPKLSAPPAQSLPSEPTLFKVQTQPHALGVSSLCFSFRTSVCREQRPTTPPSRPPRGDRESCHITCIAPAHVHVCHLLPGVCSRIINLNALPHQGPIVPSCGVQLSAEDSNPWKAEHSVPAWGWLQWPETRRPGIQSWTDITNQQGDMGSTVLFPWTSVFSSVKQIWWHSANS